MSFFRHEEIYRPMDSKNVPGRSWHDRPRPHRYDEFPAGYSSAGCAPAEPASASPAEAHLAGIGSGSTIELQRAVNRLLTPCLTQGDNPSSRLFVEANLVPFPVAVNGEGCTQVFGVPERIMPTFREGRFSGLGILR